MKAYFRWGFIAVIGIALLLAISGCSTKKKIEVKPMAIKTVTVITPPGALPDVPAEKGGAGFEKIAVAQGWKTLGEDEYPSALDTTAKKGGSIRYAMTEFPTNLRHEGKDANTTLNRMLAGMCYESLLGTNMLQQYVPGLASHWKISEDKMTFEFRIDPRTRWSDGTRVTSEDVIATWKLAVDPGLIDAYSNQLYTKYDEPVAEGPYMVKVHTTELNWRHFLYFAASLSILPAKELNQLEGPFYSDWKKTAKKGEKSPRTKGSDYLNKYQFKMFMGSGVYVIQPEDIIKDVSITLTRRSDYWDQESKGTKYGANFDKIKFLVVKDERLTFEKFKKGEIDMYYVGRAQWWKEEFEFDHIKRGLIQKRKVYNYNAQGVNGFAFNMRREPFNDLRIRKATAMLVNRPKLIEKLFFSEYLPLDSYYPSTVYANPNDLKIKFDPETAQNLLAEAGWNKRDKDGVLLKNGKRFELDLMFTKGEERFLTVIQEDLQKAGIKINLKETTGATAFSMINERKFDLYFMNWGGLSIPNPESSMRSNTADSMYTTNLPGIKDKRIDQLCDEYNICFDLPRRIQIIREIDSIACSQVTYAFGWYGPFNRIAFWNKFNMPPWILSRTGDFFDAMSLWSYNPEKAAEIEAALKDPSKKLPVGETENKYWIEWTKQNEKLLSSSL